MIYGIILFCLVILIEKLWFIIEKEVVVMEETDFKLNVGNNLLKYIFKIVTFIVTVLIIIFILYGIKLGILQDKMILVRYMKKFGIFAPIFFIFLQLVQVVLPVIPGGASCLAGVLAFGPILGFVYNYIGLVMGSCIAFYLSKKYGLKFIKKLFHEETIQHYMKYIQDKKFTKIFFLGIFLPGFPDDLLCYIAGLSGIRFRTFLVIILVGKPLALFMYSFFMKFL